MTPGRRYVRIDVPKLLVTPVRVTALLLSMIVAGCAIDDQPMVPLDDYRSRLRAIEMQDFPQTIRITDRHGALLAEIVDEGYRNWVTLNEIPELMRQAVIATEDRTFYGNSGVDKRAVARAALQNAKAGETVSGASTITMQLVRLVAFPPNERYERSMERKLREVHLASELDERLSKDQVLEAYLNVAFYGRQSHGIEAAAQRFFGLHVDELGLAEASFLAGLLQAPAALNPDVNPGGARARQRVVLNSMAAAGVITNRDAATAFALPPRLIPAPPPPIRSRSHFIDYVLATLPRVLGDERARRGGFVVKTSLEPALENRSRDIARRHVDSLRGAHNISDAGVVVLHPGTGEVLAIVGGLDYDDPDHGQVNVATSPRQPGSAFKPIVYAAAIESGWTPGTLLWDVPVPFPNGDGTNYEATNYDRVFRGPVRVRDALANSLNASTVALAAEVGLENIHDLARTLGVRLAEEPWHYGLSLALGGGEITLLELTSALATFGVGGRHIAPTAVLEIRRIHDDALIWRHEPRSRQVVSAQTAWLISDILDDDDARVPAFGAANPLAASRPIAVKTGTTNDYRDNLTVGWTPWLAVGVWTGNKDGRPMHNVLGVTGAAPVWREIVEFIFEDEATMRLLGDGAPPMHGFPVPAGVTEVQVCRLSTLRADGSCQSEAIAMQIGGPIGDSRLSWDWFRTGPEGCAKRANAGDGARLALLAPRHPTVAEAARRWSETRGIGVASPPCSALAGENSPDLGAGNVVGALR